jgi:2-polyprenyl-3-methyl-5-hydroxy-6-metoxy-1,4-benzoquinol methylase
LQPLESNINPTDSLVSFEYNAVTNAEVWEELAVDYESARVNEDSLDRLVEWPAQRELLGSVQGRSILDVGCGNGSKLSELLEMGASSAVGVDISSNFKSDFARGPELIHANMNDLETIQELQGRKFDRVMFLQSFGYASDPVRTLQVACSMLTEDGFIVLSRTQPIRYALERAQHSGRSLGEEYFSSSNFTYRSLWNQQIELTKRSFTVSDLLNTFSAARLWVECAVEPQLSEPDREKFPHKQEWLNKYLGILIFKLKPLSRASSQQ